MGLYKSDRQVASIKIPLGTTSDQVYINQKHLDFKIIQISDVSQIPSRGMIPLPRQSHLQSDLI